MNQALGISMHVAHYRSACALPLVEARDTLLEITRLCGMTPIDVRTSEFPTNGKGGFGYMVVVTFTESCAYCDCYQNTKTTWWHISSCLPIDYQIVRDMISRCGPITGPLIEYEL